MDIRDLELSRPCPIDLDSLGVDRSQPQVFCSHCQSQVTDISKMPEAEAAAFVRENRGTGVCISYQRNAAGNVRFADADPQKMPVAESPLVPVERLGHPRLRRAAAVAVLTLAACTPHRDKSEIDDETAKQALEVLEQQQELRVQQVQVREVREVREVQALAEPPVQVPTEAEPCETTLENNRNVRGRLRVREPAQPKETPKEVLPKDDWVRMDGGI